MTSIAAARCAPIVYNAVASASSETVRYSSAWTTCDRVTTAKAEISATALAM